MKRSIAAASLLAMTLMAGPALAAESGPGAIVLAQADVSADVQAILDDKRPPSALTSRELVDRIRKIRAAIDGGGLPAGVRKQLQQIAKAARDERQTRQQQQAESSPATAADAGSEEQQTAAAPETGQPADDSVAVAPQDAPESVEAPQDPPESAEVPQDAPESVEAPSGVAVYFADTRAASELSSLELRDRIAAGIGLRSGAGLSREQRRRIVQKLQVDRTELQNRNRSARAKQQDTAANTGGEDNQGQTPGTDAPGGPPADVNSENEALRLLADNRPAQSLSTPELRRRVNAMREVLQSLGVTQATARALRQKLAADRQVLRRRVNQDTAGNQGGDPAIGTDGQPPEPQLQAAINDTRPSNRLDDDELRLRIRIFINLVGDRDYSDDQRARWRRILAEDRRFLRERMHKRRDMARGRLREDDFDIVIDAAPPSEDIDAAEADDEEIEDILTSRPRREVKRRYSVEEIEASAELRDAMPRIEIDTIHFAFGESSIPEEEIENLDRVGEIIERILAKHPREVFIIEGHTDAVGSYASNIRLSRERSRAVERALTEYFVIPAENLEAIGYGERFLRIPTQEAEQENRRVSVGRATALVGEL